MVCYYCFVKNTSYNGGRVDKSLFFSLFSFSFLSRTFFFLFRSIADSITIPPTLTHKHTFSVSAAVFVFVFDDDVRVRSSSSFLCLSLYIFIMASSTMDDVDATAAAHALHSRCKSDSSTENLVSYFVMNEVELVMKVHLLDL
jgi:hypothetical protein